jgi:multimeric flavodoxin WrbA
MTAVIAINGSPRPDRNTATLLQAVLKGAASQGADTDLYTIGLMDIHPCNSCWECSAAGACTQQDDMQILYPAMESAQALVIGTPVYFDHVSAQTKIWLDRMNCYVGPELVHRFPPGKKLVIVFTWADCEEDLYDEVIEWLKVRLTRYFDMELVGVLKASCTDDQPVASRPDLLLHAQNLGVTLV